jgi:hypothetical protein
MLRAFSGVTTSRVKIRGEITGAVANVGNTKTHFETVVTLFAKVLEADPNNLEN